MLNPYHFMVIGVIASSIPANSLAVLDDGQCLRIGSHIRDLEIVKIERRWLTFRQQDQLVRLMVGDRWPPESKPEIESRSFEDGSRTTVMSRAYKDDQLSILNLAHILNQAGVESYPGGGFRIHSIDPGSIYDRIGLKDGDIIDSVNGYALTDTPSAVRTLKNLKDEKRWVIEVIRNIDFITLTVEIQ